MAIKKAIDKLHEVVGGCKDSFSDGSASWVLIENRNFEICFTFDGAGKKLGSIQVARKIYQVVDQEMLVDLEIK